MKKLLNFLHIPSSWVKIWVPIKNQLPKWVCWSSQNHKLVFVNILWLILYCQYLLCLIFYNWYCRDCRECWNRGKWVNILVNWDIQGYRAYRGQNATCWGCPPCRSHSVVHMTLHMTLHIMFHFYWRLPICIAYDALQD